MEKEANYQEPLVSIIMPNYNCAKYIAGSINSVCQQTYQNWELLIYDNGSTDNSLDIITDFVKQDPRVRHIAIQNNIPKGAAYARNVCLNNTKGEYIAFLDSDDLWTPDKLAKQIRFMQKEDIIFSYTHYTIINSEGKQITTEIAREQKTTYKKALHGHEIGLLTVIIRNTPVLGKINFPVPPANREFHEDTALWLKILQKIECAYLLNENLALYRCHKGSKNFNKLRSILYFYRILRYSENFSAPTAAFYLARYIIHGILHKGRRIVISYLYA